MAREKSRAQSAIGFGFASHWLREFYWPSVDGDRNRIIQVTFNSTSHLKNEFNNNKRKETQQKQTRLNKP